MAGNSRRRRVKPRHIPPNEPIDVHRRRKPSIECRAERDPTAVRTVNPRRKRIVRAGEMRQLVGNHRAQLPSRERRQHGQSQHEQAASPQRPQVRVDDCAGIETSSDRDAVDGWRVDGATDVFNEVVEGAACGSLEH